MVTTAVVGLALAAHVLGGAPAPPPVVGAAVTALVLLVVMLGSRRRWSAVRLTGMLGVGQLVLHQVFALAAAPICLPTGATAGAAGTAAHHGDAALDAALACAATGSSAAHAVAHSGAPAAMVAAHVVATVLTAAVLLGGERALWALWAWLLPLSRGVLVPVLTVTGRPFFPWASTTARPPAVFLPAAPRRGPPVVLRPSSATH